MVHKLSLGGKEGIMITDLTAEHPKKDTVAVCAAHVYKRHVPAVLQYRGQQHRGPVCR